MNQNTNVTGTGIAVAVAVIIAIALIFFGPRIFTLFSSAPSLGSVASSTASTSEATEQPNPQPTMNPNTADLSGVPANPTQLMTKDITIGTGAEAKAGDTVTVNYVGMLTNGTVFDASANHGTSGFTFPLGAGQVIKGWDEGVQGMKVGGKRELVIPASLGYGSQAVGPIPANSTLVFEVELLNVQASTQQ